MALQRGNVAAAIAGSVASAIRFLARVILVGDERMSRILNIQIAEARGNLASDRGIGQKILQKLFDSVPRMTSYVIQQQLAMLKQSGDYQRIITEAMCRLFIQTFVTKA